ncbi:MAG: hypothetical protein ACUVR8_10770 [Acidobacteriota bacterium]
MNWLWRRWIGWRGWSGTVTRRRYLEWTEWLGMVAWVLCLVGVVTGYQMLLEPLNQRLSSISRETSNVRRQTESLRIERQRLEQEAAAFNSAFENLQRFEREVLRDARVGQLALIDEINALARKHEVRLTDTVAFVMTDQDKRPADGVSSREQQNKPVQSYSAFEVKFGITGNYRNIRRFIHDLEQSRQFLLLQLLSFTPGDGPASSGSAPDVMPGAPPAATDQLTIMLSLTAYFRSELRGLGSPVAAPR